MASLTCYWPDGSAINSAALGLPCTSAYSSQHMGTTNDQNTCCPTNWECLASGICSNPAANSPDSSDGVLYGRTGCTDQTWDSCPDICDGSETGQAGNEGILRCGTNSACCNRNMQSGDCCQGEIANSPQFVLSFGDSSGGSATSASTSASASATSSATPTIDSSTSTPSTVGSSFVTSITTSGTRTNTNTNLPTLPGTTSGSAPPSGTSSPNQDSTDSSGGDGLSTGATAGIAVGVVLGIALLGLVLWFLLFRRRRSTRSSKGQNLPSPPLTETSPALGGLAAVPAWGGSEKTDAASDSDPPSFHDPGAVGAVVAASEKPHGYKVHELDASPQTDHSLTPKTDTTMSKSPGVPQSQFVSPGRAELMGDSPRLGTKFNPAELGSSA